MDPFLIKNPHFPNVYIYTHSAARRGLATCEPRAGKLPLARLQFSILITEQNRMKKYLEIALVAVVAVAIGKKLPVVGNYL